ncbi:MAG: hypothetical protein M3Q73_03025 [bacterium]|nr:hypothetical protein [bacterium]
MQRLKRILTIGFVLHLIFSFTGKVTNAAVLPTFGGFNTYFIPCTGSYAPIAWHFYTPLYLNTSVPIAGPLVGFYATTFAYYTIHPGQYAMGTYLNDPGSCYVGVCPYCTVLPSIGFINSAFTGTSP